MTTNERANQIIKLFIDNDIQISQQLEILKMLREKIEFARKIGAEMIDFIE